MVTRLLLVLLLLLVPRLAQAATYYVQQSSPSCSNTGGSGTLGSPWVNLYNAITTHTFAGDDSINLMAASNGGTTVYQVTTNGFTLTCNSEGNGSTGAIGPANIVLPLAMAGTSGHNIIIQNYCNGATCDTVVLSGSPANTLTWSLDSGSVYKSTTLTWGSIAPMVRVTPADVSVNEGTRLVLKCTGGACNAASLTGAGQYAYNNGATKTLYVWMPNSGDPTSQAVYLAAQQGDAAPTPVSALKKTDGYITLRKNPSGGRVTVRDGYHNLYFDDNTASPTGSHDVTLDGLTILGAGGYDYGSCVRTVFGVNITVQNVLCDGAQGEGIAFYGGGPGCGFGSCGYQISGNQLLTSEVKNTGTCYFDNSQGCVGESDLGMGVIVKGCNTCTVKGNNIHHVVALGIHVTTSTDANNTSTDAVIDSNSIHDYGYLCTNGCGGRNTAAIQFVAQNSGCANGCINGAIVQNNYIYNGDFVGLTGTEAPYGITLDSGPSNDQMTSMLIVNNAFTNIVNSCLDFNPLTSGSVTWRNNAMTSCSTGAIGTPTWGSKTVMDDNTALTRTHSNNTYWSGASGDKVYDSGGGTTYTRTTVTTYEASAVQSDPLFVSTTNLDIQSGSGLRDTGTNTNCPALDYHGSSRPFNTICDIGGFEYGASGATPTVPSGLRLVPTPCCSLRWNQPSSDTVTGFRICLDGQSGTGCTDVGLPTGATVADTPPGFLSYTTAFLSMNPGRHSLTVEAYNGGSLSTPSTSPLVVTVAYRDDLEVP